MSDYQSNQIKLINTSLIDPHPDNPRKNIGDVSDLAASVKANGLLSPLSVVPNGKRYRVIAGHRRLAACKQAGTGAVPCFVLDLDPLQQLEAMVTENCQREQLTVLEEADAIQGMLDLADTAETAATIELRALAGGECDGGIAVMASGLRANCSACMVLVDALMREGVSCG